MSRLAGRTCVAALVSVAFIVEAGAQPVSTEFTQRRVSSKVVELAQQAAPEPVAQALVRSGIPAGIVIDTGGFRPAVSQATEATGDDVLVPVGDVRAAFSLRHHGLRWREVADAIVIEPMIRGACQDALSRRLPDFAFDGPAIMAMQRAVRAARGQSGAGVPAGFVGGGPGGNDVLAESERQIQLYNTPVAIRMASPTVQEVLQEVVQQARGLGWAVRRTPREPARDGTWLQKQRCLVELFTGSSWLSTTQDLLERPDGAER